MSIPLFDEIIEPNDQTAARAEHLDALREFVGNVYPNKFDRSRISGDEDTITNIVKYSPVVEIVNEIKAVVATLAERERPPVEIKDALNARLRELGDVRVSGRLAVPPRVMGKAAFVHLSDGMSRLQIYCRTDDFVLLRNDSPDSVNSQDSWTAFGLLDHGDFIGVEGYLFITNTGELSVHVEKLQFLAKAMLPMPDKMHGVEDAEIKQRRRYLDLIASSLKVESHEPDGDGKDSALRTPHSALTTREVFERRSKIISSLRHFLEDHGYIEVETPMLTPKATGAAAKPFKTHHNALDIDLYARIAPELYLKRLVVGGFEKVYELNRNFRNEGISYKHNPEFTMLEFYCAYMDVEGMMNFCEELLRESVQKANGSLVVEYEGNKIDFSRFERLSMKEAIATHWQNELRELGNDVLDVSWLDDLSMLRRMYVLFLLMTLQQTEPHIWVGTPEPPENWMEVRRLETIALFKNTWWSQSEIFSNAIPDEAETTAHNITSEQYKWIIKFLTPILNSEDKLILALFEELIETRLVQPTFIIDFPKSISPLSKASPENPNIAERFELFIHGMEVANGFSELNDPKEQYDRFIDQMGERDRGDEEAMILDEDYIRALSYGMPPAAGIGIGIDRLVMLLTNKHSIRDVILFPHMRPEKREGEKGSGGELDTQ